jgi:hypothetical protein
VSTDKFAVGIISPTGIGGWLAAFIVWLWLEVIFGLPAPTAFHQRLFVTASADLAFAGLCAVAAYFLMTKNSKGVILAKFCLVARVILAFASLTRVEHVKQTDALRVGIACGISVLWYLYLVRSERVKAVYSPATA